VMVGHYSGRQITGANGNVLLGHYAGYTLTSGDDNVIIGYQAANGQLTTESDKLWIANSNTATPLIYGEFDTPMLKINGTLNSGMGRISNTNRQTTTYTALITDEILFCNTDGGDWTLTLPVGVEGQHFKIINCGSNILTVDGDSAETVYGETTQDLSSGDVIDLNYNSTEGWW